MAVVDLGMQKLKVGNKLCLVTWNRWGNNTYYKFATVERLTKTQAVLSDGTKLVNEPSKYYGDKGPVFRQYGDNYTKWQFETPELREQAQKEDTRQKKNTWFSNRKFTEAERHAIYDLFESLGSLTPVEKPETT